MNRRIVFSSVVLGAALLLGSLSAYVSSTDAAPRRARSGKALGTPALNVQGSTFADILLTGGADPSCLATKSQNGWFNVFGTDVDDPTGGNAGNNCSDPFSRGPITPASITYGATGSTRGITAWNACFPNQGGIIPGETVAAPFSFAVTDTPFTSSPFNPSGTPTANNYSAAGCGRMLVQVPLAAGTLALAVNPASAGPSITTAQVCAMFKNGTTGLPGITKVYYRSGTAGTNLIFTTYLAAACGGITPSTTYPVPTGGLTFIPVTSTQAVSAGVASMPGSIGYLDAGQAKQDGLSVLNVQTAGGSFQSPFNAVAGAAGITNNVKDIDPNAKRIELGFIASPTTKTGAYPIIGFTYAWYYATGNTAAVANAIQTHTRWYTYTRTNCPTVANPNLLPPTASDADCIAKTAAYIPLPGNSRSGAVNWPTTPFPNKANSTTNVPTTATSPCANGDVRPAGANTPANNVKLAVYNVVCANVGP